ncbi:MAG: 50S ribosomal protein L3 [Parcubacteria group bacterium GW2011_GWF2_38_76]|nr:MAG: 50S ribosomal protein L3 [Parcubacteria group bacterium GW2011_GWF2_38_76]HBM45372.1 50S ribosomal protein L3 [Patescibacteria group bacterium]
MYILGKKQNMTQVFDDNGRCHPVTALSVGPMTVVQVKDYSTKDKYNAVQFGYDEISLNKLDKAKRGHVAKAVGAKATGFRTLKEYRLKGEEKTDLKVGDVIDTSFLTEGDKVSVSAISKGKGFQSAIKRHGFKGQPRSHGQKHCERAPGSIGGGMRNKVPKGMRMAGRMGSDRITVKGLTIVKIDKENNLVLIRGAVPGRRGTLVEISK